MRFWIEVAHQSFVGAGLASALEEVCGDVVRTFQTAEQFFAILAGGPQGGAEGRAKAASLADRAASMLKQGAPLETVTEAVLAALPVGDHMPFSILQVLGGCQAHLMECDAPPLFLTRGGQLVLLPVLEEPSLGRLVRECCFLLQDGDHIAMVSEGYIRARGWSRRWGWRDIAIATRRLTDTGCDAEQLLGALVRTYHRLVEGKPERDVTVIAMHVRPLRSAAVWSGPPADPVRDEVALERLMAERDVRIICGDTTAQIAARLLGAELDLEPRPDDGWAEVPPVSRLEGVDLVTEGLITLGKAGERLTAARGAGDLPRTEDGATRLARALLAADRIHFIVGLAVNPAQAADATRTVPLRQAMVEELMQDLKARGKLVSVEYL